MGWTDARVRPDRPAFIWDETALLRAEWLYLGEAGQAAGTARHLSAPDQTELIVAALAAGAVASLELEGAVVPRAEMEDCVRGRLGLAFSAPDAEDAGDCRADPLKSCVADIAVRTLRKSGTELTLGRVRKTGARLGGPDNAARLADPALCRDLAAFMKWFAGGDAVDSVASPLVQAGLAHLWFETIHPYRFGSGIAGRALAERALMWRNPGIPFVPLSPVFLGRGNEYYGCLDKACRDRDATEWLLWFAAAAVEAARLHRAAIRFRLERDALLDRFRGKLGGREEEILRHMFAPGVAEFSAGMTAKRCAGETGIPQEAVSAGLANLAAGGALVRSVKGKTVLYRLNVAPPDIGPVELDEII